MYDYAKRPEYVWEGWDEVVHGPGNEVSECMAESDMGRCILSQYYFVAIH